MKAKPLIILVGIILVAAGTAWLAHATSAGIPVETALVTTGPISEFVDERAITRLPRTYLISMPFDGRVEEITLKEGMPVTKRVEGDAENYVARIKPSDLRLSEDRAAAVHKSLLARIRENNDKTVENTAREQAVSFVDSMKATVQAAAGRVTSGEAKLGYTSTILEHKEKTAAQGATSQDDLLLAKLRRTEADVDYKQDQLVHQAMVAMQKATILMPTMIQQYIARKGLTENVLLEQTAEAMARLEQVRQDRHRGSMYSPVDGVVLKRYVTNEQFLPAGKPLLEIGRLEDIEVEADVLSLDVVDTKKDCRVEIYGPAIGKTAVRGTVARVFPAGFTKVSSLGVEQQRVKVVIHFDPEDLARLLKDGSLGVGYRVRVKIFTADKSDALTVPRSALFRGPKGQWQVYAVRDGLAKIVSVEVGLINDEAVEITTGLDATDRVILAPESTLADGAKVEVKAEAS